MLAALLVGVFNSVTSVSPSKGPVFAENKMQTGSLIPCPLWGQINMDAVQTAFCPYLSVLSPCYASTLHIVLLLSACTNWRIGRAWVNVKITKIIK